MVEPNDLNTKILCTIKGKQKQINTINTDTNIKSTNTHTLTSKHLHKIGNTACLVSNICTEYQRYRKIA